MLLLGFVLNLIKTLAINTDNGTLTDKGMWIYLADKAENGWSLALLGKHEDLTLTFSDATFVTY